MSMGLFRWERDIDSRIMLVTALEVMGFSGLVKCSGLLESRE
jgi:hypothetical protein